ncbi:DUF1365 domain-containing protein [Streptomyces phaeolivaceus]|uniref:DUF1365 domain-containing protein n=1 Tax=Streptomyces phaeolivaceus TaxID=2653200 RepID=UPI001D049CFF|nr:DUF1365 domain-containing protein [Streptomyces phaeolivaceus]
MKGKERRHPALCALRHRTYMWLVDPDHPPRLPLPLRPFAGFDPRDHFTGDRPTVRAGPDAFLAAHGVDLDGGPVLMLTHARVLGYVFNPLTLYWCRGPEGEPRCVVAEVHNTYGGRHGYLLRPDATGTAHTDNAFYVSDKEFYVSPFFPVDGRYRMRLPSPGARLDLTVHLDREGGRAFTATVRGTRRPVSTSALLRLALRHPWSTLAVSAAIRAHGILLHLRGLPVQPRPDHRTSEKAT